MSNQYKYSLVVVLFLLGGCTDSGIKKNRIEEAAIENDKEQSVDSIEDSNGVYYSDSMIMELSKSEESVEIDSTVDLHSFDRSKFQYEYCDEFTIEMLIALDEYAMHDGREKAKQHPQVSKSQKELLGVTEYLCDKTFNGDFGVYVFHASGVESHCSNSIQLLVISNESNKYDRLVLSQKYLREGYEYDLTSRFVSYDEVEVTKVERYQNTNSSFKEDSTSVTRSNYVISDDGNIKVK